MKTKKELIEMGKIRGHFDLKIFIGDYNNK